MKPKKVISLLLAGISAVFSFSITACSEETNSSKVLKKDIYADATAEFYWPEEQYLPTFNLPIADKLDYIDLSSFSTEVGLLLTSMKAIVNKEEVRIYSKDRDVDWYDWVYEMGYSENDLVFWDDPYALLDKYITGEEDIIICDSTLTDTYNLASTLAGITPALIATPEIYYKLCELGYDFNVIFDCRNRFSSVVDVYEYVFEEYFKTGLVNRRAIFGTSSGIAGCIREYAIASNGACVYLDATVEAERQLLIKYLELMESGESAFIGWFPNEVSSLNLLSKYGVAVWSGDFLSNMLFHSSMKTDRAQISRKIGSYKTLENKIYVMMGVTDGDNLGSWMQQGMKRSYSYVLEQNKKTTAFPISWSISPMAYYLMPSVLRYYYDNANPELTDFYSAFSGVGYTFIGPWDSFDGLTTFFARSNTAMKDAQIDVVNTCYEPVGALVNDMSDEHKNMIAEKLTNVRAIYDSCRIAETKTVKGKLFTNFEDPYADKSEVVGGSSNVWKMLVEEAYMNYMISGKEEPQFIGIQGYSWDYETMYQEMLKTYQYCAQKYGAEVEFVTMSQFTDLKIQYEARK